MPTKTATMGRPPMDVDACPIADDLLAHPENFLTSDPALSTSFLTVTKWLYDSLLKPSEPTPGKMSHMDQLLVEGFDLEQVWEQLAMQNVGMQRYVADKVERIVENGDIQLLEDQAQHSENESDDMEADLPDGELIANRDSDEELESDDQSLEQEDSENDAVDESDAEDGLSGEEADDWNDEFGEGADLLDSDPDDRPMEDDGKSDEDDNERPRKRKSERSVVDDDFFSLEEMERFADFGEARDTKKARLGDEDEQGEEDEEEDEKFSLGDQLNTGFSDDEDDDNANDIGYEDFFGPRRSSRNEERASNDNFDHAPRRRRHDNESFGDEDMMDVDAFDDEEGESKVFEDDQGTVQNLFDAAEDSADDEGDEQALSTFERQQRAIQRQIAQLEEDAIGEKPWTMKGEAAAKARPLNSLLAEPLEYEAAAKPVPVITEELTTSLEEVIKQRIKDQLFDDVVRKAPPRERDFDPNRRIEINEEKSSKSLAQVYEEDYLRRTAAEVPTEKDEALKKQHDEIDALFKSLCQNLDALSNHHFTPKPINPELEVQSIPTNVPTISLEEITPSHVSSAQLVAPQELLPAKSITGEKELSSTQKKRLRDKSRRKAGKEKKEKDDLHKAVANAQPKTALQEKKQKESALKQLMGQKNVTIVGDDKTKKMMKASRGKKGQEMAANLVEKGGKIQQKKAERAEFLRL
ncbi:U3 small nucleolar ribonucleoprotein complex, subunit Mpp10 [Gaertneriomyces semiglobifer]|nr:U3 small nucleolar ribonucleoprotein complex, subunit Mpp10 [Gaertneriomyces semiglobifer]